MKKTDKKESSRKEQDQKKRFVDFMQKLKEEGKLSEYFRETDRLAEEQDPDPDWDVLLK